MNPIDINKSIDLTRPFTESVELVITASGGTSSGQIQFDNATHYINEIHVTGRDDDDKDIEVTTPRERFTLQINSNQKHNLTSNNNPPEIFGFNAKINNRMNFGFVVNPNTLLKFVVESAKNSGAAILTFPCTFRIDLSGYMLKEGV